MARRLSPSLDNLFELRKDGQDKHPLLVLPKLRWMSERRRAPSSSLVQDPVPEQSTVQGRRRVFTPY